MTPSIYASLGNRFLGRKRGLWMVSIASVALLSASVVAFGADESLLMRFGLPFPAMLALTLSWGLLITVHWFATNAPLSRDAIANLSGYRRTARLVFSWYASALLTLWFVFGALALPVMAVGRITSP